MEKLTSSSASENNVIICIYDHFCENNIKWMACVCVFPSFSVSRIHFVFHQFIRNDCGLFSPSRHTQRHQIFVPAKFGRLTHFTNAAFGFFFHHWEWFSFSFWAFEERNFEGKRIRKNGCWPRKNTDQNYEIWKLNQRKFKFHTPKILCLLKYIFGRKIALWKNCSE